MRLASQALSTGVADATNFLNEGGVEEFIGGFATVQFNRMTAKIFDSLNSRNPFGKDYKASMKPETMVYFEEVFSEAIIYFKSNIIIKS